MKARHRGGQAVYMLRQNFIACQQPVQLFGCRKTAHPDRILDRRLRAQDGIFSTAADGYDIEVDPGRQTPVKAYFSSQ
jgi:hypothetical protein